MELHNSHYSSQICQWNYWISENQFYINIFHSFFTQLPRIIEKIKFELKKNHQISPHIWWERWFTVILLCVVLKYVKVKRKNWYSHVQQIQWEKLKRERERVRNIYTYNFQVSYFKEGKDIHFNKQIINLFISF